MEHRFDLSGGSAPLDLVNTLGGAGRSDERLGSYGDLLAFARQAGLVDDAVAARLSVAAASRPVEAESTRKRALALREALFRIFTADEPPQRDLAELNRALATAMAQLRVRPDRTWGWSEQDSRLDAPIWPIAREAAELLVGPELARVRECAADDCRWLFLDTSKNRSRRWCDMKSCGNRAKARSFYQRRRATEQPV